jgi:hypothetical protein
MSGAAVVSDGSHHVVVMRLGQARFLHGTVVLRLQSVAEFFWPFSPTGTRTCDPHTRGSSRAVSEW